MKTLAILLAVLAVGCASSPKCADKQMQATYLAACSRGEATPFCLCTWEQNARDYTCDELRNSDAPRTTEAARVNSCLSLRADASR